MTLCSSVTGLLRTVSATVFAAAFLVTSGLALAEAETAGEFQARANREVQAVKESVDLTCLKAKRFQTALEGDRAALEDDALKTRQEEVEALEGKCDQLTAEYEKVLEALQGEYQKRYGGSE